MDVIDAIAPEEVAAVRDLFLAYNAWFVDNLGHDLCFQGFDAEMASFPAKYARPAGGLLLGRVDGAAMGAVAFTPLAPGICEMKRMFVQPGAQGTGLGRTLALAVMERAREAGHHVMVLDTLETLTAACALYERLGFRPTADYNGNPLKGVRFMRIDLTAAGAALTTPSPAASGGGCSPRSP